MSRDIKGQAKQAKEIKSTRAKSKLFLHQKLAHFFGNLKFYFSISFNNMR